LQTPAIELDGTNYREFADRRCAGGLPLAPRRNQMDPPQQFLPRLGRLRFQRKDMDGMALVATGKGDCDVYNAPDYGTPYATEAYGFR